MQIYIRQKNKQFDTHQAATQRPPDHSPVENELSILIHALKIKYA